jgi:hypothetical protein
MSTDGIYMTVAGPLKRSVLEYVRSASRILGIMHGRSIHLPCLA